MIYLAQLLKRVFQGLVVAEPLAHVGDLFAVETELPGATARIADGEHGLRMPVAPCALGATTGMARDPFDDGSAQDIAGGGVGEALQQLRAGAEGLFVCHPYK